jgi:hypothetical protein
MLLNPPSTILTPSPSFHPYSPYPFNSLIGPVLVDFISHYMSHCFHPHVHSRFLFGAFWVPYLSVSGDASCERCLCLVDFYSCFVFSILGALLECVGGRVLWTLPLPCWSLFLFFFCLALSGLLLLCLPLGHWVLLLWSLGLLLYVSTWSFWCFTYLTFCNHNNC